MRSHERIYCEHVDLSGAELADEGRNGRDIDLERAAVDVSDRYGHVSNAADEQPAADRLGTQAIVARDRPETAIEFGLRILADVPAPQGFQDPVAGFIGQSAEQMKRGAQELWQSPAGTTAANPACSTRRAVNVS